MGQTKPAKIVSQHLCEPIEKYCADNAQRNFCNDSVRAKTSEIRVIELFAGVGGFRIGLEHASNRYKTVWNSQWEPSTKTQDASAIYQKRFGGWIPVPGLLCRFNAEALRWH